MSSEPDLLANAIGVVGGRVTPIEKAEISKKDAGLLQSNALSIEEDPFSSIYEQGDGIKARVLRPTYDPIQLYYAATHNNVLSQCVDAMEVNIDGTGYSIDRKDGEAVDDKDPKVAAIKDFFDEPYPDTSFLAQRRKLRRDLEITGNGYIEAIRNPKGEIVLLNTLESKLTRLVALDAPVVVSREIMRFGVKQNIQIEVRERRFCQIVGKKLVYFKEFGSKRKLDKLTGVWDENVLPEIAATEVIHLKVLEDVTTAYGVPRWINQVPSVLGSRKAEEFNLEFFDHGGLPPALILVQGGQLTTQARAELTNFLAGKAKNKQRGVLVEAFGLGGDLNSAGSMKIGIERFGAERQGDSMFENYDQRCFERVRSAFRLPPMFLGYAQDYSYATAYASYMVAEAQVFKPEREEFDEVINVMIMAEIAPDYWFRSLPLSVVDAETQFKGLELLKDKVDDEGFVEAVNALTSLTLTYDEEKVKAALEAEKPVPTAKPGKEVDDDLEEDLEEEMEKQEIRFAKMGPEILQSLADDWAKYWSGDVSFEEQSVIVMKDLIDTLSPSVRKLFNGYVAMRMLPEHRHDFDGTSALLAAAGECLSKH